VTKIDRRMSSRTRVLGVRSECVGAWSIAMVVGMCG
jgi:hypothetical protein